MASLSANLVRKEVPDDGPLQGATQQVPFVVRLRRSPRDPALPLCVPEERGRLLFTLRVEGPRMAPHRCLLPALLGGLLLAGPSPLPAQEAAGTITGKVIDGSRRQPLAGGQIGCAAPPLRT